MKKPIWDDEEAAEVRVDEEASEHAAHVQTRENLGGNSEFAEQLAVLREEFPDLSGPLLVELLDFMQRKRWMADAKRKSLAGVPKWMAKFIKILRYIKNHPNQTAIYAVMHIWDEPLMDDINRHRTQTEFAEDIDVEKAAVNNACMDAMRHFRTKPRRDQRKVEARGKMAEKRIGQLTES